VLPNPEEIGKGPDLSASTRQKPKYNSKKSGGREKSHKGASPKRNHKKSPRAKNGPESHKEREEKMLPKSESENKSKFRSRKNLED
jgi:ATP-dependent RNA helicase RhlE